MVHVEVKEVCAPRATIPDRVGIECCNIVNCNLYSATEITLEDLIANIKYMVSDDDITATLDFR